MTIKITSVFTFNIEITFDEWVAFFDSNDSHNRLSEFDIKPLFRGQSSENPQKVIVIHQGPKDSIQKFFEVHGSWIATHGVTVSSIEISDWI